MAGVVDVVTLVNFIGLWVFAFTRWPALGNTQAN